ncbi:MAG: IS4 family transposase [Bacteroidota bacterium]
MHTTFEELLAPLNSFTEEQGNQIDQKSGSRKLFFADFTNKIIFAFVMKVPSLRQLVTELSSSEICQKLGLEQSPFSTLKDGFTRFSSQEFEQLFHHILKNASWLRIKAFDELGIFRLVDGSVFPTLCSMDWAAFRKTKKAIRLHLSFDLNSMIPVDFIGLKANSSERHFLLSILEKGVTYIADRGYFSFDLAAKIEAAQAFFILRIKNNLNLGRIIKLQPSCTQGQKIPPCFKNLTDEVIRFQSDQSANVYRLICFTVMQSQFKICTNRLDLTTLQVIILYAYRWQIELFFKFIKRSLNGLHLFNHTENGVNVQFYILMITAVLQLRLKQKTVLQTQQNSQQSAVIDLQKVNNIEQISDYDEYQPDLWIKTLTIPLQKLWKISCHWIRCLQNFIAKTFDNEVITKLGVT